MLTDLVIFRHGKAQAEAYAEEPSGDADFGRALTARGRAQAGAQARRLRELGFEPDVALVSSAVRAVQTWEEARPHFGDVQARITRNLYLAPAPTYLDSAEQAGKAKILLIAHNNGLHDLANWLMSDQNDTHQNLHHHLPTSAIAWFTTDSSQPSGYRLLHYLAPAAYRGEG